MTTRRLEVQSESPVGAPSTRGPRWAIPEWVTAGVLLLIPMLLLTIMRFIPLLREVWMSFTNTKLTNPNGGRYVGLHNYDVLLSGPNLHQVLLNTAKYAIGTTTLALVGGLVAALVINTKFTGRAFARAVLVSPWAVPGVAAGIIWLWMFTDNGIIARTLQATGLPQISWLASPHWAMVSVVVVSAWLSYPVVMLVTLSALQSVPEEITEAARIDGADRIATFRFVTWPHIRPTFVLVGLLVVIWSVKRWEVITVLTGGGPVNSTATIVVATQKQAFSYGQVGMGAAYAVVGILIASCLVGGFYLLQRREAAAMN
jgi:multiple sugar transport system permease protein